MVLSGCGDGTGPGDGGLTVTAQTNETQFGARNTTLLEPLQAIVVDPVTKTPQNNVAVSWRVVSGSATLTSSVTMTDAGGVASAFVKLGNELATSIVEAFVPKLSGSPARFTIKAVDAPVINAITPTSADAGDTITITGQNFSPVIDDNVVLFGGFRGNIISATATQLRAVVPLCVPSRTVNVQPMLGSVGGNSLPLNVTSSTSTVLQLERGQPRVFVAPSELACFRLPGGIPNLSVLLMPQNVSEVIGSFTAFELAGLAGTPTMASIVEKPMGAGTPDESWELNIRKKERELLKGPLVAERPSYSASSAANCPQPAALGQRCEFMVINKDDKFDRVTAEIKAITTRAIVYQDVNTPTSNGLTTADFNQLGTVFDDPIYATDVALFGQPSDFDNNSKIFILLTPVVNALTPRASGGFIAGFFYGCDLLARSSCNGSNEAEIFYALTTDPNATFSDVRTRGTIMASLPAVLAHEFQHMINFAQRNKTQDALWLAEGMAHHAEDAVADAFEARGDLTTANQFRAQNTIRANRYLRNTSSVSLLAEDDESSLELRGAAWLFVKYLADQYGNQILAKLTRSQLSSVGNVTTQTGKSWHTLMSDWGIALWADDAPELAGVLLRRELFYQTVNLRSRLRNPDGSYPLKPTVYSFADFIERETVPASSQSYVLVKAGAPSQTQLNLTLGGQRGGSFAANAAPQMTIMRVN